MEWNINIFEENNFAEIVTSGIADKEGSLEMAKDIRRKLIRKNINKVLMDHRNVSEVSGLIVDVYERPIIIRILEVIRPIKIALLIKKEHEEFFEFLAIVFSNRGFKAKLFLEKANAIEWLKS
jgi:hypothetical protein